MPNRTPAEVIHQFNKAFVDHDPDLLVGLIGTDCVMEAIQPAPEGERIEGEDACLAFWQALAGDDATQFEPEQVDIAGERATIRWRYRYGAAETDYVRGVNLMRVADGVIVEALGYSKTPAAEAVPLATTTSA
ncbi:nuclear transport factor 2 family protein [Kribbella deserti]|uniref:Nuclear transport factor 2 family protein n=1 Tax=Kribbella deserti TaxID=1926257 RepID=A0ABV6QFQ1_9ACTN